MKKSILFAALALAASATFAQTSAFVKYDYDRADSGQWKSQHEGVAGVAFATKLGTFDLGVVGRRQYTNVIDDAAGLEVGYSQGLKVGSVTFTGRAAVGEVYEVDLGSDSKNTYYSVSAEALVPLRAQGDVSFFAGVRHRGGLDGVTTSSNRFTGGVQFAVTKAADLKVGFSYARQGEREFSGVTTAVAYKF